MTKNRSQDRDRSAAAETAASALPQGSLGAWLRTQREARGVALRDIADASKISLRYLEAIEHDRLDVLPAPVFTRGFLREYARIVGLDADEVVNLHLLALQAHGEAPAQEEERREVRARPAAGPSTLGYGLLVATAIVLFLSIAALLTWWAGRRDQRSPPAAERREAALPEPAPATPPPASSPAPVAPASAPAQASDDAVPAAAPLRVVLEFTQDCWVEHVVDGRRRTSELRAAGEVLTLDATESVLLTLGNATGVRIEVDGRPLTLPLGSARVARDFRIDRELAAQLAGSPGTGP